MDASEFVCETTIQTFIGPRGCGAPAQFIYGPECEAETGQLMYLCNEHAGLIDTWRKLNPNEPVECPTHGRIGKVKDYLILKRMP
jgi:hypothetical protein